MPRLAPPNPKLKDEIFLILIDESNKIYGEKSFLPHGKILR